MTTELMFNLVPIPSPREGVDISMSLVARPPVFALQRDECVLQTLRDDLVSLDVWPRAMSSSWSVL